MIVAEGLSFSVGGAVIVGRLSLTLAPGMTVLVGASGCGKSTLLRVLAGLREPTSGTVRGVPERRAFVFQDHGLLPWLSLSENVGLPSRFRAGCGPVEAALDRVGLSEHAHKLPHELSGGQRMRGSLARALVARPEVVFLDEAFGALDGVTRRQVQQAFCALAVEQAWTVVMVTHDLHEAVGLGDRVIALAGPPLVVVRDDLRGQITEAELWQCLSGAAG